MFDLASDSKQQVLEQMVQRFTEQGYISDKAVFLKDVLDREEIFSTYIDYGIGLPHGKSEVTNQAGVCIARLQNGVVWDAETGDKADMVIMIAVKSESDNNLHLQILAKLSRALMHEEFRGVLKKGDLDTVYQTLLETLGD